MPKSTGPKLQYIHASVGPPKPDDPKPQPSFSRAATLNGDAQSETSKQREDLAALELRHGFRSLSVGTDDAEKSQVGDMTVSYGPDYRTAFISPLTGFVMTAPKVSTSSLFDSYYKGSKLKIRKYYFTAEGHELSVYEDENGQVGWTWSDSDSDSGGTRDRYKTLKKFLAEKHSNNASDLLDLQVSFGDEGSFWAVCGENGRMLNLPETLQDAIHFRGEVKKGESTSKSLSPSASTTTFVFPRILELGAKGTYFVLWDDFSYQYTLQAGNLLLNAIRERPQEVTTFCRVALSPWNLTQYFVVYGNGKKVQHARLAGKMLSLDKLIHEHWAIALKAAQPKIQEAAEDELESGKSMEKLGEQAEKGIADSSDKARSESQKSNEPKRRMSWLLRGKKRSEPKEVAFISHPA